MVDRLKVPMGRRPPTVWVVGDVMLDRYHIGAVERVSPEAPVPVLLVSHTFSNLGGAAGVAANLASLGARVALAGVVGRCTTATEIRGLCGDKGIGVSGLFHLENAVTTVKERVVSRGQQLLRLDREERRCWASSAKALIQGLGNDVRTPDAIVVSDYGKGVVSRDLIESLLEAAPGVLILVDPKGDDFSKYRGVSIITPNEAEATAATGVESTSTSSLAAVARLLGEKLPGTDVLVTRGAHGMALFLADGTSICGDAVARQVVDVTGAGDTAIAAITMARLWQLSWSDALRVANVAAGLAVGKFGSATVSKEELRGALSGTDSNLKIVDRERLSEIRRGASASGKKIVFANGCFDLLHAGHLSVLQSARAMGDILIVGLNSDESVRELKGPARPVVRQGERAEMLAALEAVDFVTIFDEGTPLETLRACRPDVLVKGGDYQESSVVGAGEVRGWGGRVAVVPTRVGFSTTGLVDAIERHRSLGSARSGEAPLPKTAGARRGGRLGDVARRRG